MAYNKFIMYLMPLLNTSNILFHQRWRGPMPQSTRSSQRRGADSIRKQRTQRSGSAQTQASSRAKIYRGVSGDRAGFRRYSGR